jgi:hypothetical protein
MALNPRYIDPSEDDPDWQYWTDLMLRSMNTNQLKQDHFI